LDDDYPALKWAAVNRGFNEFYGFMGRGGHDYFRLSYSNESNEKFVHPLYRGKERIDDKGYLTDRLSDEAVAFIDRNKATPFFLYLAYNAVHAPPQVPQETINRIKKENPDISEERAVLMAMLYHLDQGIGRVTKKLKDEHLFENTLLFFLTDNGGAKGMHADNTPLRGYKASFYEGGIRTPFIVSYPKKIAGGQIIDTPIISLDILPTVLDALDKTPPIPDFFDGKSLLPILYNKAAKHHETLFWSTGGEGSWAVRNGYWKLIFQQGKTELFDLKTDPSEQNNLAEKQTDIVAVIIKKYENWIRQMSDPLSGGSRFWHSKQEKNETEPELTQREKIRAERRAQKKSERSK
jgi:arylsulfatase A-like enzyme